MDEAKKLLNEEIEKEISKLEYLEDGTPEKATAIEQINKLYRLRIDESKVENDFKLGNKKVASDEYVALEEKESRKWTDWIRIGLDGLSVVAPLVFYGVWMKRGFKFEETGTFTSDTFRGFIKFIKPTRR